MLTRDKAIEIAKHRHRKINVAVMAQARGDVSAAHLQTIEARLGYRHGWFQIGGYSIAPDEFATGAQQPVMD